jgi:hypothetical protein
MSDLKTPTRRAASYEADFYAWTLDQAEKLRARRHNELDWENLAEEVESVGRSQKTEIRNRLVVLLHHLLKWEYQPDRRCHSWQSTIGEQRTHIEGVIEDSPSLRDFPAEVLDAVYPAARRKAALETKLALGVFPERSPYSAGQALDPEFMPGRDWSPDELLGD